MGEEARRERILQVAERLFRHYGPQKTTVADIAREARIAIGSVYLDFTSKEAILDELSHKRGQTVAGMMRSAAEGAPPGERLCRMLKARVAALILLAGEGAHACDLVRCSSKQKRSGTSIALRGFDDETRELLREELEAGIGIGEYLGPADPQLRAIEAAFAVLSPPYIFYLDRREAADLADHLSRLLVEGIRRR